MTNEKYWYQSRTIWGALVAILASVLNAVGMPLDSVSQAELVENILQLISVTGALVAIFGRLSATRLIM